MLTSQSCEMKTPFRLKASSNVRAYTSHLGPGTQDLDAYQKTAIPPITSDQFSHVMREALILDCVKETVLMIVG